MSAPKQQLHQNHLLRVEPPDVGDRKQEEEEKEKTNLKTEFCSNQEILLLGVHVEIPALIEVSAQTDTGNCVAVQPVLERKSLTGHFEAGNKLRSGQKGVRFVSQCYGSACDPEGHDGVRVFDNVTRKGNL